MTGQNRLIDDVAALRAAEVGEVSSSLGSPIVRRFPFAFNTPNLLTGHTVYIPTIGDVLLNAWIELDTAWDGTTPSADVGQFPGNTGWFYNGTPGTLLLDVQDGNNGGYRHGPNVGTPPRLYSLAAGGSLNGSVDLSFRWAPGRFTTADPVKIVVSQDGLSNGADPVSTQGSAVLYLVTATPV